MIRFVTLMNFTFMCKWIYLFSFRSHKEREREREREKYLKSQKDCKMTEREIQRKKERERERERFYFIREVANPPQMRKKLGSQLILMNANRKKKVNKEENVMKIQKGEEISVSESKTR